MVTVFAGICRDVQSTQLTESAKHVWMDIS